MNKLSVKALNTEVLEASPAGIARAVFILKQGGIVALPTETVYGLAGNALSAEILAKIYRAKNRPADNPLIWHVPEVAAALELFDCSSMSEAVLKRIALLAKHFWPGPLTMVAKKSHKLKSRECNMNTVAVRIPKHPLTLNILKQVNFPLAMPSANLSTRPSATSGEHVLKTLNGRIDAVLDGGVCSVGLESSVIRVDTERVKVLRLGLISSKELEQTLGEPVELAQALQHEECLSPGQRHVHYAPLVAKVLLLGPCEAAEYWNQAYTFIARDIELKNLAQKQGARRGGSLTFALGDTPTLFAQELYAALYSAEENPQTPVVLVSPPAGEDAWAAIIDRLMRSAGKTNA